MTAVDKEAFSEYQQALKMSRSGLPSTLGPDAPWAKVKPAFYADSRVLSEGAVEVFESLTDSHPPYGLLDWNGEPITSESLESGISPWRVIYSALWSTGRYVMEKAQPRLSACPYHNVLQDKLSGVEPPLEPYDFNERGLDTFRSVATPGAMLNSSLFASLVYRLPAIQKLHGNTDNPEAFARNSVSLLREPLSHPQQWAAAFVLSLGTIREFLSPNFLNDALALRYTEVETVNGANRLTWAIPTERFTTRQIVEVKSRARGSEQHYDRSTISVYPEGTMLRDIQVDEPTIGCPGNLLANAIWQRVIDVAARESLQGY